MDLGDIISGIFVLLFIFGGPIANALNKNKPPRPQPPSQPLQPSRPRPQSPSAGPTAQPVGGTTRPASTPQRSSAPQQNTAVRSNDLQARLEEARKRVQAQQGQASQPLVRAPQQSRSPSAPKSGPRVGQPVPVGRSGRGMAGKAPAPERRGLMASSPTLEGRSLEERSLEGKSLEGLLRSTVRVSQSSAESSSHKAKTVSSPLHLDKASIQNAIIWKQILDKPRYKQRLQERQAFLRR